ncbi:hypothetical protein [Parasitella parasitica]|uniref:Uncharacterized protein n=1 Tax=Parasitella parasitica TaxID=35722 RepID=A0A0B7N122_9FUNG|nr:hypothetical protein [Parasitella parasitica]
MAQQTLGIISLTIKGDILNKIAASKMKLIYEKHFDLTTDTSLKILNKTISKTLPVYGFILEGSNAIKDWFQITSTASPSKRRSTFLYASTLENAQHQVDWFKNLVVKNLSIEKNASATTASSVSTVTSNSSTSSIPIKIKKQQQKVKPVNVSERKTLRTSTAQQQQKSTATRLGSTTPTTRKIATITSSKIPNSSAKAVRPTSAATTATAAKVKNTAVTPTKRMNNSMKSTGERRGSLVSVTATSSKKLLSTTAKGGVIKNTPPVSVLTGRTRKPSRLTEKRPVVVASQKIDTVKQDESEAEVQDKKQRVAPSPLETAASENVIVAQEATCGNMIQEQQIISYPSTCSSAATDEHDAEVAAATSKKDTVLAASHTTTTTPTSLPLLCNSGRSSFSPSSFTSLPRPETPEVDQLRLRFETIIQTSAPSSASTGANDFIPKRPSFSKISQQEIASRIKEMKPRGPVGARVKSMVELFMDENLNKWEF